MNQIMRRIGSDFNQVFGAERKPLPQKADLIASIKDGSFLKNAVPTSSNKRIEDRVEFILDRAIEIALFVGPPRPSQNSSSTSTDIDYGYGTRNYHGD